MNRSQHVNITELQSPPKVDFKSVFPATLSQKNLTHRSIRFSEHEDHSLEKPESQSKKNVMVLPTVKSFDRLKQSQRQISEDPLNKSRDGQNNSRCINKKYEYGDEGVKVREEVVEKYKASNYIIQRDILQKFKKEAEDFRRNRRPQLQNQSGAEYSHTLHLRQTNDHPLQNQSFLRRQHQENIKKYEYEMELLRRNKVIAQEQQRIKQQEQRRLQEERRRKKLKKEAYLKRQKENMIYVSNLLREIDQKIKENSQQLSSSIRRLREDMTKDKKIKPFILKHKNDRFFDDELDFCNLDESKCSQHDCKHTLPVVLYKDKYDYAKSWVGENKTIERINRKSCKQSADNLKNIIAILHKNEQRIKLLSSLKGQPSENDIDIDY